MTSREQFVFFVVQFLGDPRPYTSDIVQEALRMPSDVLLQEGVDKDGDRVPPVVERPMDAAWEFVRYWRGGPKPQWMRP